MPSMTYDKLQEYRANWERQGNRLMSREDVAKFDAFSTIRVKLGSITMKA